MAGQVKINSFVACSRYTDQFLPADVRSHQAGLVGHLVRGHGLYGRGIDSRPLRVRRTTLGPPALSAEKKTTRGESFLHMSMPRKPLWDERRGPKSHQ